jgi:hypothetical protein
MERYGTSLFMVYTDDINERKHEFCKENSKETGLDPVPRNRTFVHTFMSRQKNVGQNNCLKLLDPLKNVASPNTWERTL